MRFLLAISISLLTCGCTANNLVALWPDTTDNLVISIIDPASSVPVILANNENEVRLLLGNAAYSVQKEKWDVLVNHLAAPRTVSLVSTHQEGVYGLESGIRVHIRATESHTRKIRDKLLVFGLLDPTGREVFFMEDQTGPIYRTDSDIVSLLRAETAFWIHKKPLEELVRYNLLSVSYLSERIGKPLHIPITSDEWKSSLAAFAVTDITNIPFRSQHTLQFHFADHTDVMVEWMSVTPEFVAVRIENKTELYIASTDMIDTFPLDNF